MLSRSHGTGGPLSTDLTYTQRGNEYRFRSRIKARSFAVADAFLSQSWSGDIRHWAGERTMPPLNEIRGSTGRPGSSVREWIMRWKSHGKSRGAVARSTRA